LTGPALIIAVSPIVIYSEPRRKVLYIDWTSLEEVLNVLVTFNRFFPKLIV
jgi:hypothetical protein